MADTLNLENMPFPLGEVVGGRFELSELLGVGGVGAVYRAHQRSLARDVAIKVLLRSATRRPESLARFEREARVASKLHHPNGVEIYDVGEHDGAAYLAMELLRGRTLRHASPHVERRVETALEVGRQVADVLVAAHRQDIVHRDLKPENIFIEDVVDSWRAVVVDFGLAFVTTDRGGLGRLTSEGLIVGTPAYLSPEQALGTDVGPPSDIYSLGCVVFELLVGRPPFVGSKVEVLSSHRHAEPPTPTEVAPTLGIPREADTLLGRMLAKRPDARPTAAEALAGFESLCGRSGRASWGRVPTPKPGQRSIPTPSAETTRTGSTNPATGEALAVAVIGPMTADTRDGLASQGIAVHLTPPAHPVADVDAVLVAGDLPIADAVATGLPVVVESDTRDMGRVAELLRQGVAEVVGRAPSVEDITRKLRRAVRRHRRKR